jgi:hypothetical protein
VMFQTKLLRHMTMLQVVGLTKSLGQKVSESGANNQAKIGNDIWRWADASGDSVVLTFTKGKLTTWELQRAQSEQASVAEPLRA